MKETFREFRDVAINAVRESGNKILNDQFIDGYDRAANICLGVITKKIDELFSKINSDSPLSQQEQFLLLKLNELKSETVEELDSFFKN